MMNRFLICVYAFLFAYSSVGMESPFDAFKRNIVGKEGSAVQEFITPKLKGGLDAQIAQLSAHMQDEGHFGIRTSALSRNAIRARAKRWGTFFVKPDGSIYTSVEQNDLLKRIWLSGKLIYVMDVPGAKNIVCLDGEVDEVCGIAFSNSAAVRESFVTGGNLDRINAENLLAIRLANLGREPVRKDFASDEEFEMAQMVYEAGSHFVRTTTIRVKLNIADDMCEFNTCFPKD